uniref:HDC06000 n=1 Tax=Drosophila melanogaster TaxID=7227 RepID=Q6IGL2_DROME|nr:TPA_inf: HDC06000 [Drosophila melanogaster]
MYYSRRENHFSKVNNIASVCGLVCRWVVGCELWVACCPDSGRVDPCHLVRFQGEGPPKWVHSHVSRACYMLDMYVRRLQQHQPEQVKPFPRSTQALLTHATSKPMPHHNHVDDSVMSLGDKTGRGDKFAEPCNFSTRLQAVGAASASGVASTRCSWAINERSCQRSGAALKLFVGLINSNHLTSGPRKHFISLRKQK